MPNIITVLNIADRKASSKRAAMSTMVTEICRSAGYWASRLLVMKIRFNSTPSSRSFSEQARKEMSMC